MNMTFPKNNKALAEMFRSARTPDLTEFQGEYLVDMLTVFPSFKRFGHRKLFYSVPDRIEGHNVLFGREWGHFFLEEEPWEEGGVAVINYGRKENRVPVRLIRDQLKSVEKGRFYLGRFNVLLRKRLYFLGYFSLSKIER